MSPSGDIFIPEDYGYCIRKINSLGVISTFAGIPGVVGYSGDGGPATSAKFKMPNCVAFDDTGNVYIADQQAGVLRKINPAGLISTLAGSGVVGYSGDGGPATQAKMVPNAVAVDKYGYVYVADFANNRIRKIVYNAAGVNEVNQSEIEISIFPNPATTKVTISASCLLERINITNLIGQEIYCNESLHSDHVEINTCLLPAGIYFAKINNLKIITFIIN